MDKITVSGMEFYGYHGVYDEEREKGQLFLVDMELYLPLSDAGNTDNLEKSVDYGVVFDFIRNIVEGEPMRTIEAVAEKVATGVLEAFPAVERAAVTLHKPNAPINGIFQDVSVTVDRSR